MGKARVQYRRAGVLDLLALFLVCAFTFAMALAMSDRGALAGLEETRNTER